MLGRGRLQLSFPPLLAGDPVWSPDGKTIAFAARAPGKPSKIFVLSAEGGNPQQVTSGERNDGNPCWSPDGNSIIFAGNSNFRDSPPSALTIDRIDLMTKHVSSLPGSQGLQYPLWSPGGRYVAAATTDLQQLMLFDFTTQNWTNLAKGFFLQHHWSRDEKYIYFDNTGFKKRP